MRHGSSYTDFPDIHAELFAGKLEGARGFLRPEADQRARLAVWAINLDQAALCIADDVVLLHTSLGDLHGSIEDTRRRVAAPEKEPASMTQTKVSIAARRAIPIPSRNDEYHDNRVTTTSQEARYTTRPRLKQQQR